MGRQTFWMVVGDGVPYFKHDSRITQGQRLSDWRDFIPAKSSRCWSLSQLWLSPT